MQGRRTPGLYATCRASSYPSRRPARSLVRVGWVAHDLPIPMTRTMATLAGIQSRLRQCSGKSLDGRRRDLAVGRAGLQAYVRKQKYECSQLSTRRVKSLEMMRLPLG